MSSAPRPRSARPPALVFALHLAFALFSAHARAEPAADAEAPSLGLDTDRARPERRLLFGTAARAPFRAGAGAFLDVFVVRYLEAGVAVSYAKDRRVLVESSLTVRFDRVAFEGLFVRVGLASVVSDQGAAFHDGAVSLLGGYGVVKGACLVEGSLGAASRLRADPGRRFAPEAVLRLGAIF